MLRLLIDMLVVVRARALFSPSLPLRALAVASFVLALCTRRCPSTPTLCGLVTPPKKAQPPFDGVASLVVDRGAGTGLGPKFWSYRAWVL